MCPLLQTLMKPLLYQRKNFNVNVQRSCISDYKHTTFMFTSISNNSKVILINFIKPKFRVLTFLVEEKMLFDSLTELAYPG